MENREVREDETISEWITGINIAKNTQEIYIQSLRAYTEYTRMSPEQLLDEAEQEADTNIRMRNRKVKRHLVSFRKWIIDSGLSDHTVRARMTGVKNFYKFFGIDIPII